MLFDDFPLIFKGLEMISAKQYVHFPSLPMYVELYPNTLNFVRGRRILSRYTTFQDFDVPGQNEL